jgi:hypothetical protein
MKNIHLCQFPSYKTAIFSSFDILSDFVWIFLCCLFVFVHLCVGFWWFFWWIFGRLSMLAMVFKSWLTLEMRKSPENCLNLEPFFRELTVKESTRPGWHKSDNWKKTWSYVIISWLMTRIVARWERPGHLSWRFLNFITDAHHRRRQQPITLPSHRYHLQLAVTC